MYNEVVNNKTLAKEVVNMHISLYDFVRKSDFKEYKFYLCVNSVCLNSVLKKDIKLKGRGRGCSTIELEFNEKTKSDINAELYDLSKCINLVYPTADSMAFYLDKFSGFSLYKMEHCDNKCCIILK